MVIFVHPEIAIGKKKTPTCTEDFDFKRSKSYTDFLPVLKTAFVRKIPIGVWRL